MIVRVSRACSDALGIRSNGALGLYVCAPTSFVSMRLPGTALSFRDVAYPDCGWEWPQMCALAQRTQLIVHELFETCTLVSSSTPRTVDKDSPSLPDGSFCSTKKAANPVPRLP